MDLLGSKMAIFGPIYPNKWNISITHVKKWMILDLLAKCFKPVEKETFLKWLGPILGSKWSYLGSRIGIFGPICPNKWNISGNHVKKWMMLGLLAQLFKTIEKDIFLKWFGPILGSKWIYLGSKIDFSGDWEICLNLYFHICLIGFFLRRAVFRIC